MPRESLDRAEMEDAVRRRLAELRIELGLSQQQLADRASMHQSALSRIESGTRRISFGDVERLAAALGISVAQLIGSEAALPPAPAPRQARPRERRADSAAPDAAFAYGAARRAESAADDVGEALVSPTMAASGASMMPDLAVHGLGFLPAGEAAETGRGDTSALSDDTARVRMEMADTRSHAGRAPVETRAAARPEAALESADVSAAARRVVAATFKAARLAGSEVVGPTPPSTFAARTTTRPGQLARLWRRELGVGPEAPLPDLLTLLELRAGLPVTLLSALRGPAGLLLTERDVPFLFVNATPSPASRRLALAHLLGHHALGHSHAVCRDLDPRRGERAEVTATWFALEFLAPAAGVAAWLDARAARLGGSAPDLTAIAELAAQYGISPPAALERCRAVGRVAPRAAQPLAAAVEARADEIAAWAAFAGEFRDSLSEPLSPPGAGEGVRVVRVPRRLRHDTLTALAAGRLDLSGAAALLWETPGRLAASLRGLRPE